MTTRIIILLITLFCFQTNVKSQSKLTPTFCEMLGMLDEYSNRFEYKNDLVEYFYPNELGFANYFLILTKTYEKEMNLKLGVYDIKLDDGISLYSKSLSNIINSFYINEKDKAVTLDRSVILNSSEQSKFAFIKGAYSRYGNGNSIQMANGGEKIKTLAAVLKSLKINNVKIYEQIGEFCIPRDFILIFEPTEILKSKINLKETTFSIDLNKYRLIDK